MPSAKYLCLVKGSVCRDALRRSFPFKEPPSQLDAVVPSTRIVVAESVSHGSKPRTDGSLLEPYPRSGYAS